MCGRFVIIPQDAINEIILAVEKNLQADQHPVSTMDAYPTNTVPIIRPDKNKLEAEAMKWGYPMYQGSGVVFNTRAESADFKPMWKDSLEHRRCIVPSYGFYEWQHVGEHDKQKYRFLLPDSEVLLMAGVYKPFRDADGSMVDRFSIVTTTANPSIADVHDRMPLVLQPGEYTEWLFGNYKTLFDRSKVPLVKIEAA